MFSLGLLFVKATKIAVLDCLLEIWTLTSGCGSLLLKVYSSVSVLTFF